MFIYKHKPEAGSQEPGSRQWWLCTQGQGCFTGCSRCREADTITETTTLCHKASAAAYLHLLHLFPPDAAIRWDSKWLIFQKYILHTTLCVCACKRARLNHILDFPTVCSMADSCLKPDLSKWELMYHFELYANLLSLRRPFLVNQLSLAFLLKEWHIITKHGITDADILFSKNLIITRVGSNLQLQVKKNY